MSFPPPETDRKKLNGHWANPSQAVPWRGYYIAPSLEKIMKMVADVQDISVDWLRSSRQSTKLVNARSVVAILALEFHPRLTPASIEGALLRGKGMVNWYETRHADRLTLYPEYRQLYDYCRVLMQRGDARSVAMVEGKP